MNDTSLSKFLSLVLRHNPGAAFITLDAHGWADVQELLQGCRRAGKPMEIETLERIVREDAKERYGFDALHTKIRANQGHSIKVDVELQEKQPPKTLYHGTATRFLKSIQRQGITRQSRQYVHLSADEETAIVVGKRHGTPVVLKIDADAMYQDGYTFYLSENKVWLCKEVPYPYVQELGQK